MFSFLGRGCSIFKNLDLPQARSQAECQICKTGYYVKHNTSFAPLLYEDFFPSVIIFIYNGGIFLIFLSWFSLPQEKAVYFGVYSR